MSAAQLDRFAQGMVVMIAADTYPGLQASAPSLEQHHQAWRCDTDTHRHVQSLPGSHLQTDRQEHVAQAVSGMLQPVSTQVLYRLKSKRKKRRVHVLSESTRLYRCSRV